METEATAAVAQAFAAAQAALPGVVLAYDVFAERARTVAAAALQSHSADLYLAWACAAGDRAALAWFDEHVLKPACTSVRGIDGEPAFVDEIRQQVRARLLVGDGTPKVLDYAGRGALQAWVGVAAVRQALMAKRSQSRKREVDDESWANSLSLVSTGNPELELIKRQHAQSFSQALRDAALGLEPRLRAVLGMHFVEGLSIDEIGAVYAVHRATAARWVQRAREQLFADTRARLVDTLGLTPTEIDRVAALVQSQVDVSLSQLFIAA